ncbi:MAG TPA: 16S rRNA (cytosine(1402)-N(4))-methyltransferase RsmH [Polyangiaceae bacterium]|nr:16S rRNA (cytosine(1402)-N(4))-methyltransferase RsmH [Polyangiaceae bacterium]
MPAFFLEHPLSFTHVTVMPAEVVQALNAQPGGVYVDATAGGGGHSLALLQACPEARVIAFDRDPMAVEAARARLTEFGERATVVHAAFDGIARELAEMRLASIDGLIADLGISSEQLARGDRGMSFRLEGPIDMRMDPTSGETARELIERVSQDELADVLFQMGEERRSRRVARCIKQALEAGELETTVDLRRAVVRAVGPRRVGGIDPATRTFQALRVAVNGELDQLAGLLAMARELVRPGGAVAFISFHSLEDRLVKRALVDRSVWQRQSNKPVLPGEAEQAQNPRARSAKLRAALRVENTEGESDEPESDRGEALNWYGARGARGENAGENAEFHSDAALLEGGSA